MVKQVIAFKDNYTDFSIHNYTNKYINGQRVLRIFVLYNYNFSSMIKFCLDRGTHEQGYQ